MRSATLCLATMAMTLATAADAETLADAIAQAYQTNPTLQMQRAQLRGTDESYVQARAAFGPTADLQVTATWQQSKLGKADQATQRLSNPNPPNDIEQNTGSGQLTLSQSLYSGGRMSAELAASEAQVWAGREALRAVEGNVILQVIQAYAAVRRDQEQLAVRAKNLDMLQDQLKETQARLKAGEVTRTDVAQAEAQLESERALYAAARGQLLLSRSAYTAVVGQNPGSLEPEPPLPGMPATVDEAFDIAEVSSPDLRQAKRTEEQSRARLSEARAAGAVNVTVRGQFGYTGSVVPYDRRNMEREVVGEAVISKPIFTSGLVQSGVRQELAANTSDRINIEAVRRSVVQNLADAWNQMLTARAATVAQAAQVKSATIAFQGMRVEYRAGERSTLDVLIAEETLRDAELALIAAHHDEYAASAAVLRQLGRLEARALVPGVPTYAPAENFRHVAHSGELPWEGALRTVDGIGRPAPRQEALTSPPANSSTPVLAPGKTTKPADDNFSERQPVIPIPGTAPKPMGPPE